MRVLLAGYNVDKEVIEELKQNNPGRQDITPETLSAAYARISRDPRPIDQLRKLSRQEVEKARKSNSTIIFKMGHHSIAEHAVFNFDVIGVSRLAFEEIEKFRLCAYTEKSQRYQKLEDDFIVPEEIKTNGYEKEFVAIIKKQNAFYHQMVKAGIEPEDSRYITSLATQGQVGQTINARNLEFLLRRFASHPLSEIRKLGLKYYNLVKDVAPSIILFTQANDFDQKTYVEVKTKSSSAFAKASADKKSKLVKMVGYTQNADDRILAALLHTTSNRSYSQCLAHVKKMNVSDKKELVKACFKYAEFYDRPLREFEYADLTFEVVVSAACFGQLKRHRMLTMTSQLYDPGLGITIPTAVKKAKLDKKFSKIANESVKVFAKIAKASPIAAQYVLTNSHRKRVLVKLNVRELFHLSRLREDLHAQWDIMDISRQMTSLAKKVMPVSLLFIGGKDSYPAIYKEYFGKGPKTLPQY